MLVFKLPYLILFHFTGVYCNWEVVGPNTVQSVSGSCALLPCSFNYPSNVQGDIVKMWYKDFDGARKLMYHPTDAVDADFLNRVESVGDSVPKNCTVLIKNLKTSDSGTYVFRFEVVNNNKWLGRPGVMLEVRDDPLPPEVVVPPQINEGSSVTFQCSTPYFCPDGSLLLEWKNHPSERSYQSFSVQMDTRAVLYTKNLTTSLSWKDDKKKIICAVSSGNKKATTEITLNVVHSPKGVNILLHPSSGNTKEGDHVTLTCQVNSSNPSPTSYTWYKEGQKFSEERIVTFHSLSRTDGGEYQCEVANTLARVSSESVRLVVFSARVVASHSQDIKEGEAVTLSCEVPGVRPEDVHYSWFKNSVWIKESSVRSLSFPGVSISDVGYYFCKVQNDKGSTESPPVLINVKFPPRTPSLTSFLETQHGNLAIIHCTVESNPLSELTIYKDGNLIGNSSSHGTPSERTQVISTGNSLSLRIQDVTLSDEGLYKCTAKNAMGSSSASLQLTVETARVVIKPSPETEEGKEVTLTCVATRGSEEGTTYSWYKNSRKIKEDMKGKELVLHRLSKIDAGSYFCKAEGSQGASTSPSVTLHVLFSPRDLSLTSLVSSHGVLQAVIGCIVDSDPPSQMFLYRDRTLVASSTQVLSDKRYEVSHSTNSLQLEIRNVVLEDEGRYTCLANNSYGQVTDTTELTAETAKIIVSPPGEVREGSGVNLTCFLKTISDNRNYSYSWYKNNILYTEGGSSLLGISQVSSLDSGFYYCTARNSESSKTSAVLSLNVAYAPRHLQVMSFQDTAEGTSAFIRCTVDSFPSADMSLYREDLQVASSRPMDSVNERYRVTSSHNELTVNIKNLRLEDEGKYKCTAKNSIGSTSQTMSINVQTSRVLVSPSTEVLEGSQVILTCNFLKSQLQEREYIWYKNSRWHKKTSDNSLVLDNIKTSDTGYYHCVVQRTEDNSVSPSVFLHVSYGPRTPVLSSFWEAQRGHIGIIQCSVDSDPPSSLAIYFQGEMIWSSDSKGSPSGRIRGSYSQNMVKMEISEVRMEDEGTYLCAANNSIGESRATVNFTAETIRIAISPSSMVQEGQAVNLTCIAASEDANTATYTWYKNGAVYSEGSRNVLQFTNVTSEDRGGFHCRVQSPRGTKDSQSVMLNVLYPPKNVYIKSFLDMEHSRVAIILGGVDSNPPSDLSLYKDGRLVASSADGRRSSERIQAYFLPNTLRLEITNIKSSDEGNYVLIAENNLGTNQASVTFNMEDVHVLVSPSTELREGHSVTMTCEVLDSPQEIVSYTWYKNSRWFQDIRVSSFRLGGVSGGDAGSYACTAHTSNSSKTSPPVSLSVLYPPRNLSLTSFLELQGRQLGVILCTVDSNPPAQMYLLKGKESLDSSSRLRLSPSHNTLRLEIRDITTGDQGEYTCQARNSLGTLERSIRFTAKSARLRVVPSEEIYEGHSVTLTCEVPRVDNTTYIWYKNNRWLQEGPEENYVMVNVSSSETGSYHCLAKHWTGDRTSPLVGISVLYGPKNLMISSFLDTHHRQSGIIICNVDSHPPSTIAMYKNDQLLGSSASRQTDRGQKYWTSKSHNYLRLEIRDVTVEDYGRYICTANNTLGTIRSSIDLNITGESGAYKAIAWLAIVCILCLVSGIIGFVYRKKITEKFMRSADQEPIEMDNKETSHLLLAEVHVEKPVAVVMDGNEKLKRWKNSAESEARSAPTAFTDDDQGATIDLFVPDHLLDKNLKVSTPLTPVILLVIDLYVKAQIPGIGRPRVMSGGTLVTLISKGSSGFCRTYGLFKLLSQGQSTTNLMWLRYKEFVLLEHLKACQSSVHEPDSGWLSTDIQC
ncbi:sialoadhesin-like [Leptodactylus fuscus]|uniref:sialoadhesin n=1 Tax=Leptodactylus fuscus TaxID=238119 RepID=UPI003F4EA3E3